MRKFSTHPRCCQVSEKARRHQREDHLDQLLRIGVITIGDHIRFGLAKLRFRERSFKRNFQIVELPSPSGNRNCSNVVLEVPGYRNLGDEVDIVCDDDLILNAGIYLFVFWAPRKITAQFAGSGNR